MPRMFEGGPKYEVQNDEKNLREFFLNMPVMDNKVIYIHFGDSLKRCIHYSNYVKNLSVRSLIFRLENSEKQCNMYTTSRN